MVEWDSMCYLSDERNSLVISGVARHAWDAFPSSTAATRRAAWAIPIRRLAMRLVAALCGLRRIDQKVQAE
jgi:hypothetical protein